MLVLAAPNDAVAAVVFDVSIAPVCPDLHFVCLYAAFIACSYFLVSKLLLLCIFLSHKCLDSLV